MFESVSYQSLPEHIALYEALEASMERANMDEFFDEKDKSRKRRRNDQDPPPPPPDSDPSKKSRHDSGASGSSQPPAPQSSSWKTSDTKEAPLSSSNQQSGPYSEQPVKDVPMPDTIGDMSSFINWFCKRIGKKKLRKVDLGGLAFKVVKSFYENSISLQFQMEECHQLLTDQVDLVNPEGHRLVSDVSKPLPLGCPPVRSHIRILSVISINTFKRYGYAFMKEIIKRRVDYNEYKISKADFKNLHSNDFEVLYMLHVQGKLNHLPGSDKVHLYNVINLWIKNIVIRQRVGDLQLEIESYQTNLNLTEPRWDALDFLFKEDYTIINKPSVVIYKDRNDRKKMLRENEMHKFSDGTLTRVLHNLDYMVKDFMLYQYNLGMEYRIWYKDDKRRSKEFMEVIERRIKIQKIFRSLESFVGGRLRDVD
nr:hypothetical protein [Tanacetum cinerariifolium]